MSNVTINALPNIASLATGDKVAVWDVSAGIMGYATVSQVRGSAAVTDAQNTFTTQQIISPVSTGNDGLAINMPAGSVSNSALTITNGGVTRLAMYARDAQSNLIIATCDLGTDVAGPLLLVGRNSNATGPASGAIRYVDRSGSNWFVWADDTGVMRIHSAAPTNLASDTAGTVIGAQTSAAAAKNILGEVEGADVSLRHILNAAKGGIKTFSYKNGSFGGQIFEGIITDFAPRYGMDRDEAHPSGKSLNEIQLFSDLIQSVALLAKAIGLA